MTRLLVALTPYAVAPPRHGPQVRVAGELGNLGPGWEVVHFSQSLQRTDLPVPPRSVRAGEHWVEHRMRDPVSAAWLVGMGKLGHYPAAYADRLLALAPRRRVRAALARADAVLVSPHYQFPWVRRHTPAATGIAVDCHCIEGDVWPARRAAWTRVVAREIRDGEIAAYRAADTVFVTCEEEGERILGWGARRVDLVPNGVDVERFVPAAGEAERREARRRLGLDLDGLVAVFVGSSGYANVRAVEVIEEQAAAYTACGVTIVVAGRVGSGRRHVRGVVHTGEVADVAVWLRAADIALCPLLSGSGTSLKTVEYLAAGIALLSTPVGVRGLGVRDEQALVLPAERFPEGIARLAADPGLRERLGRAARRHAEDRFSWRSIGAAAAHALEDLARARDRHRPA